MSSNQTETTREEIRRLMRDALRLKARFKTLLPEELTALQSGQYGETFLSICSVLYEDNSFTMRELSTALSVPFSTATRMVDGIVERGYASRLADSDDRRIVRVALTAEGKRLYEVSENYMLEHWQRMLSGLTPRERRALFSLFKKVITALKAETGIP